VQTHPGAGYTAFQNTVDDPASVLVNRWAAEMAAIQKESSDEY
jgi:hypothetical protein